MNDRIVARLVAVVCAAIGVLALAGCKPASQFSDKEMQQLKEGPPAEMPAEARKAMQDMRTGANRPTPPRPKGQPGPGAPF
ncbi:MAG: hypothetical protein GX446_15080 [Chthonomonadales bacterium]|nr:hypothetical protein [Chthonomonadales bacterium]